jgi:hypothetical protein
MISLHIGIIARKSALQSFSFCLLDISLETLRIVFYVHLHAVILLNRD